MSVSKTVLIFCLNLWCINVALAKLDDDLNNESERGIPNLDGNIWIALISKLNKVFKDSETVGRILFYLQEQQAKQDNDNYGPALTILLKVIDDTHIFEQYAKNLAEDTKKANNNERFKDFLDIIYSKMLDVTEEDSFDEIDNQKIKVAGFHGMIRAFTMMSRKNKKGILNVIKNIVPTRVVPTRVLPTRDIMANLVKIQMSHEAFMNIVRWWNGEISGKRAAKNIIDSFVEIGGYSAGSYAGGILGAYLGPVGILVGGVVGGILGGQTSSTFVNHLTTYVFNLPRSEALENAFNFFGLSKYDDKHTINNAYRKKCLQYHPDKGGSNKEFHHVQIQMAIIKAAKNDY